MSHRIKIVGVTALLFDDIYLQLSPTTAVRAKNTFTDEFGVESVNFLDMQKLCIDALKKSLV